MTDTGLPVEMVGGGQAGAERDQAWKRIMAAAKRYDVEVTEPDWHELARGGKDRKR
jgi:hypothetical protein